MTEERNESQAEPPDTEREDRGISVPQGTDRGVTVPQATDRGVTIPQEDAEDDEES